MKLLFLLLYYIGAARLAAWWNRDRVMILGYHGVTEREPTEHYGLHINDRRFAAQLDHLRARYNVIPLKEYVAARRERRSLPPRSVVLTFDDAYRNFLIVAAPLLAARRLPATVYAVTDYAAGATQRERRTWQESDDEEYMTWAEMKELQRQNFEFGSHTCSHPRLTGVTAEEAARELAESRRIVEERLGEADASFAYPCGAYTPELAEVVRATGYSSAVTCDRGPNEPEEDQFRLRRVLIGDETLPEFAVHVSGLAWLLQRPFRFAKDRARAARTSSATARSPEASAQRLTAS